MVKNSISCHRANWPLLLLLLFLLFLKSLNEASGDIRGLPLCDGLCRRLTRAAATGGIPLLRGWSQRGGVWVNIQSHLFVLIIKTTSNMHTGKSEDRAKTDAVSQNLKPSAPFHKKVLQVTDII